MMSLVVDIRKNYGKFQLDVSFETGSGHVTGLLGASGCGKSVTLKCIAGIETPDEGRIILDGRVLFDREKGINLSPQRRHVGYLFQNYALFPNMTVKQNITVGVRDRKAREETAERLIQAFGLAGNEHKYPRQLSGGQQQRTALARILASEPEALLLDEPFSALDSYLKWQVEGELADLLESFAGPVLFVTHSRDEVRRICHQACVLDRGRSQAVLPVDELFRAPRTLSACLLSGCKNVSRARPAEGGKTEALDWGVTLDPGRPLPEGLTHVGIRAHFVRPADGPGPNRLPCIPGRAVEEMFSTAVNLSTPGVDKGFSRLRLELSREEWAALKGREQLWVELPPESLLLLSGG